MRIAGRAVFQAPKHDDNAPDLDVPDRRTVVAYDDQEWSVGDESHIVVRAHLRQHRYGLSVCRGSILPAPHKASEGPAVRFLPGDGGVLVATEAGLLVTFDARTGKQDKLLRGARTDPMTSRDVPVELALSEDDTRVAVAGPRGDVTWVELSTQRLSELAAADGEAAGPVQWSGDGERLAFQKGEGVWVAEIAHGGAAKRLEGEELLAIVESRLVVVKRGGREVLGVSVSDGQIRFRVALPIEPDAVVVDAGRKWLFASDGLLHMIRLRDGKTLSFELQAPKEGQRMVPIGMSAPELAAVLGAP